MSLTKVLHLECQCGTPLSIEVEYQNPGDSGGRLLLAELTTKSERNVQACQRSGFRRGVGLDSHYIRCLNCKSRHIVRRFKVRAELAAA